MNHLCTGPFTFVYASEMYRTIIRLVIVSLLFVSMEGVADVVDEMSFHQTHHAHDAGYQWFPDSDGDDHEGDACEHFCHAHVVALTGRDVLPSAAQYRFYVPVPSLKIVTHSKAPPTPPPNS